MHLTTESPTDSLRVQLKKYRFEQTHSTTSFMPEQVTHTPEPLLVRTRERTIAQIPDELKVEQVKFCFVTRRRSNARMQERTESEEQDPGKSHLTSPS